MSFSLIILAFVGGLFMFLAPCTLPIVPGYLGFISGTKPEDLENPETKKESEKKILKSAIFFVIGFSIVFILFGVLAGFFGRQLATFQGVLTKVGGILIIFFGLFMLGVFNLKFLKQDKKIKMPKWLTLGTPKSSFIVGSIFAVGWTPCVGPILASILLLASTTGTVASGAILLAVFSLGLGLPFLIVAFAYTKASSLIAKSGKIMKWVSIVGGIFLVGIGVLLLIDQFSILLEWGYRLLSFINYEGLENLESSLIQ